MRYWLLSPEIKQICYCILPNHNPLPHPPSPTHLVRPPVISRYNMYRKGRLAESRRLRLLCACVVGERAWRGGVGLVGVKVGYLRGETHQIFHLWRLPPAYGHSEMLAGIRWCVRIWLPWQHVMRLRRPPTWPGNYATVNLLTLPVVLREAICYPSLPEVRVLTIKDGGRL